MFCVSGEKKKCLFKLVKQQLFEELDLKKGMQRKRRDELCHSYNFKDIENM